MPEAGFHPKLMKFNNELIPDSCGSSKLEHRFLQGLLGECVADTLKIVPLRASLMISLVSQTSRKKRKKERNTF